ncbi:hypothetical protein ACXM2N_07755 [Corynebacterium sp. ZY180755]
MTEALILAQDKATDTSGFWLVYLIFIFAGLFAGGTWSMYKNGSTIGVIILGALTAIALMAGVAWIVGLVG